MAVTGEDKKEACNSFLVCDRESQSQKGMPEGSVPLELIEIASDDDKLASFCGHLSGHHTQTQTHKPLVCACPCFICSQPVGEMDSVFSPRSSLPFLSFPSYTASSLSPPPDFLQLPV